MPRRGLWLLTIGLVALVALNSVSVPAQKSSGGRKGVAVRQVAEIDITGTISSDGRFLSYTDWGTGNLAVRDLKTEKSQLLTHSGYPEFAYPSIISPDGQQVAYGWTKVDGSSELRLINLDGSGPRVIYCTQKSEWIEPRDWSPDGNYIGATLFRQKVRKESDYLGLQAGRFCTSAEIPRWALSPEDELFPGRAHHCV